MPVCVFSSSGYTECSLPTGIHTICTLGLQESNEPGLHGDAQASQEGAVVKVIPRMDLILICARAVTTSVHFDMNLLYQIKPPSSNLSLYATPSCVLWEASLNPFSKIKGVVLVQRQVSYKRKRALSGAST